MSHDRSSPFNFAPFVRKPLSDCEHHCYQLGCHTVRSQDEHRRSRDGAEARDGGSAAPNLLELRATAFPRAAIARLSRSSLDGTAKQNARPRRLEHNSGVSAALIAGMNFDQMS